MATEKEGFRIELSCDHPEWWRFNTALMCGCYDEAGERIGFSKAEDHLADVGGEATLPAAGAVREPLVLCTEPCARIELYVYVIPHTLPEDREVDACRPFEAELRVAFGNRPPGVRRVAIDQWAGASLHCEFSAGDK